METETTKPANLAYEDFAKLDIRAGTIVEAEAVPKSKKLLKLTVSFGEGVGNRTVMAGIASSYTPDTVLGIRVLAVLNLAPRTMAGVESTAMLLAGRNEDGSVVLAGSPGIATGSEIG
jgi:methionyl-tRNA synthetase